MMPLTEPQKIEFSKIRAELRVKGVGERITSEELNSICDDYGIKHPPIFPGAKVLIHDVLSYIVSCGASAAPPETKTCPWCHEPAVEAVWTPRYGWIDLCQHHHAQTSREVISHLRQKLSVKESL